MAENLDQSEWGTITIRVPPELITYGPSLTRFIDAMIYKLRRNSHKGKWENMPLKGAMTGLRHEVNELEECLRYPNTTEILTEAADVANQALIVAEIALEVRIEQK